MKSSICATSINSTKPTPRSTQRLVKITKNAIGQFDKIYPNKQINKPNAAKEIKSTI